jgi:hypothetical protein
MRSWNGQAFCANCGAKLRAYVHAYDAGFVRRTATTCPRCGVALTGRISPNNEAKLAPKQPVWRPFERAVSQR